MFIYREALCPLLKKVFGEEVDCSSPEVRWSDFFCVYFMLALWMGCCSDGM